MRKTAIRPPLDSTGYTPDLTITPSLTTEEKYPLILFLVLFPLMVLGIFAWLVINHHTKLYAPSDFDSEEGFLTAGELKHQI